MFNRFNRFFVMALVAIVVLFTVVMPIVAQEEDEPEPPTADTVIVLPEGTPSLDVAVAGIIAILHALFSQPFLAPLNTFLVGLSKKSVFLKRFSSANLKFAWAAILFAAWMVAQKLGFGLQFESGVGAVNSILTTFGTYVLGVTATSYFSGKAHTLAKTNDIPILGSGRTLTMTDVAKATFVDGDLHAHG